MIGKKVRRVDGYQKVTGKAQFGDDLDFKDMLYAACRYTDIPVGNIESIDINNAAEMKGVGKIALFDDVPGETRLGPIRADQYPLVKNKVFYSGDVIAVVAAKTKEIACRAAEKIKIKYKPQKGIFDPREAIKTDSRLIHPEFKSNVVIHYPLRKGDIKKGFKESDTIIERDYQTGFHEHAYIEPESITAVPDIVTNGVKIYGSIQNPFTTRKVVAKFMNLKMNQVDVVGSNLGGSFGGKDDVINYMACRVALLSKLTGKPVQLTNTREDSIKESYKRHPYYLNYKVGFNKNGKLKAMKINIIADSGAYSSQSFFVTWRSVVQATGPYEIDNVQTDIRAVYTNNTYTAAFRGFGSPQVIFAQESLMDEIAEICHISPLQIRLINGYKQGSRTASNQTLNKHKVSLKEVLKEATEKSNYRLKHKKLQEKNQLSERFKYGIGLSCSFRGCSLGAEGTDATSAIVAAQADGSVYVLTGLNENGQGLRTTFSQIAAEILGISLEDIVFLEPHTANITDGGPTVASRGTLMGGNAVIAAANKVKNRIFASICDDLETENINETKWKNGYIICKNKKRISFKEAAEKAYFDGVNLSAYGWYKSPDVSWDEETGQGNAYFTYVYGCQVAEIKLDRHTGKVEVLNMTAAHDVGRVINRLGAEGQVYGGVAQGIGYGILEDYNIINGEVKSANYDEYLVPTIKDIKNIQPILIENEDKFGPFGAKSLGEPTLELGAAAINNAFRFATGKSSYRIPLTLEEVYLGKNLRKPSRKSEEVLKKNHQNVKLIPRINNIDFKTTSKYKDLLQIIANEDRKIIAGGTDVLIEARKTNKKLKLLNILAIPELSGIKEKDDFIEIGATTTFEEIINNDLLKSYCPILVDACRQIGSKQIRNRATLGGNIVNAAPCADSVPSLIAYNANLLVKSLNNKRLIDIEDFIIKNYRTQISQNEIVERIIIPKKYKNWYYSYFQLGRRKAVNITRISISLMMQLEENLINEVRLVAGSLFYKPKRIPEIEDLLSKKKLNRELINLVEKPLVRVIENAIGKRWSAPYKIPVFVNMTQDALLEIYEKVGK